MIDTAASIAADVISSLQADGIDARFTLLKAGVPTGPAHNKSPGTSTPHDGTCMAVSAAKAARRGMTLEGSERCFQVFGLGVEPETKDKAKIFGGADDWNVRQVDINYFGEEAYGYLIKLGR